MTPDTRTPGPGRGRRALLITGALVIATLIALYLFRGILLPFLAGGLLAFLLYPVVKGLERLMPWRARWPTLSRTISVLVIYAATLGVIAGALFLIVPPVFRQINDFIDAMPRLYDDIRVTVEAWSQEYITRIPEDLRQRIQDSLAGVADMLVGVIRDAIVASIQFLAGTLGLAIALASVPIFLYYLLKDQEKLASGMYSAFPDSVRVHVRNVNAIVAQVVGHYIRAQIVLALAVGIMVFLGLFLMGVRFSVLLGVVAALSEFIPIIGPWISGITGVLVTLATDPEKVLWVILLYIGIQLLENTLLVPRIQGSALNIHPIVVIIVIVVGSQVAGIWGVLLGPPLAATARDIIKYFQREWNAPPLPPPAPEVELEEPGPAEKVPIQGDDDHPDPIE